jgi:hypothetical protein
MFSANQLSKTGDAFWLASMPREKKTGQKKP